MAIKDKGFGESGRVGFDRATEFDSDGKATGWMEADDLSPRDDWYLEVIGLDCWENDAGDDFFSVDLFEPRSAKVTRMYRKITARTMWILERSIRAIFGQDLPADKVQGAGGRMPAETRRKALGRFVKVSVQNGDYDRQEVMLMGDQWFGAPDGVKPMFDHKTGEPTGAWPTNAAELLKKRGQGSAPAADDDGDDW